MKIKKRSIFIALITAALSIIAFVFFFVFKPEGEVTEQTKESNDSKAVIAGKMFAAQKCDGEGPVEISTSPMKEEDFAFLIPYGMMVDGHVTPIDHQYFSPSDFFSERDTYEVRAVADARITSIQHRVMPEQNVDEYRLVFSHTCTFFTYFDLVTSLSPKLMDEIDTDEGMFQSFSTDIEVEEGELIGYIGGQTLDFAVWDFEKPLDGFIFVEHYEIEPWKRYTADPLDYYSDELVTLLTEKNLRVAEPISGKIDHDLEGKLIGTWFLEDTNWYEGDNEPYYSGHLSIAPHHIDPTATIISIGDFNNQPKQFVAALDNPDPSKVSTQSGIVKYDLMDIDFLKANGEHWDKLSLEKNTKVVPAHDNNGCALFKVQDDNKLNVEFFPDRDCSTIANFTNNVNIYER